VSGAFVVYRVLIGLVAALIFLALTPFVWRKLVHPLERLGWVSGIIASVVAILSSVIGNLPVEGRYVLGISAIVVLGVTAGWSRLKKSEADQEEKQIVSHRSKLMTQFKDFAYTDFKRIKVSKKPIELSWQSFIELFTYHKEFLQHLCTGHIKLYASLDENQARFQHGLDELTHDDEIGSNVLQGVCEQCINLHDKKDRHRLRELLSTCV
jgi:hypothetical protein